MYVEYFLYVKVTVELVPEHPHRTHRVNPSSITSESSIGTMVMFLSLDKFQTFSRQKSGGGHLTPWQRGVPFWSANPSDVFKIWGPFGPHSRLPQIHLQPTIVLVFWHELRATTMDVTWPVASVWTRKSIWRFSLSPAWYHMHDLASISSPMLGESSSVAVGLYSTIVQLNSNRKRLNSMPTSTGHHRPDLNERDSTS